MIDDKRKWRNICSQVIIIICNSMAYVERCRCPGRTVYHRSLTPMTARTTYAWLACIFDKYGYRLLTIAAIIKTPANDIHRLSLRHHLALSYRDSSTGPYRRVYSLGLSLVSSRLLVLWFPSSLLFTDLAGRGKRAPIIQAGFRISVC